MLAAVQRVLALAGTPVAAILAIGIVAQVVNLWRVEQTYFFSYVEAWHAAGLIDRWVLIGLGVKYLLYGLASATILLIIWLPLRSPMRLLIRWLRRYAPIRALIRWYSLNPSEAPEVIQSNHAIGWIQTSTSPNEPAKGTATVWWTQAAATPDEDAPSVPDRLVSYWVRLIVLATALMLIFLPLRAYLSPMTEEVVRYLPQVDMNFTTAVADATNNTQSAGQTFTGVAQPVEENGKNIYEVDGSIQSPSDEAQNGSEVTPQPLTGILLSHDSEYWYVLARNAPYKGTIVAVPLDKASEIRVTSPQKSPSLE